MIHGHHFHFADLPELARSYASFGFVTESDDHPTIRVEEMEEYTGFARRETLRYLSGRPTHYLTEEGMASIGRGESWGMEVVGVLSLAWDAGRRRILYGRGGEFSVELLRFWIWHTFFPLVLDLERSFKMLHVGAVEVGGGPVLFAAPAFGGKSTMTDYFIRRGHSLYADDTLPCRREKGRYLVYPSFPYHRPYREPETLGYRVEKFAREAKPIRALLELEAADGDAKVEISPLTGLDSYKAFFYSHFIKFPFMKKERMELAADMARNVPAYRVTVPWEKKRLPEVYEAIVEFLEVSGG